MLTTAVHISNSNSASRRLAETRERAERRETEHAKRSIELQREQQHIKQEAEQQRLAAEEELRQLEARVAEADHSEEMMADALATKLHERKETEAKLAQLQEKKAQLEEESEQKIAQLKAEAIAMDEKHSKDMEESNYTTGLLTSASGYLNDMTNNVVPAAGLKPSGLLCMSSLLSLASSMRWCFALCTTRSTRGQFKELKKRYPLGTEGVPWRTFGEVDAQALVDEGLLREEHWVEATAWQHGIWLTKWDDVGSTFPPFLAQHAFKKRFEQTFDGKEVVVYSIREDDETIKVPRPMPKEYTGKPLYIEEHKSAAFVKAIRKEYKEGAEPLLQHLKAKYEEFEKHSGNVGSSGYSSVLTLWNEEKDREMTGNEMLELLIRLMDRDVQEAKAVAAEAPAAKKQRGARR